MRIGNWKKITAGALSICMMATCAPCLAEEGGILQAPVTVHAETNDVIVTGTCGKNATWNYNRTTKIMTITGTGTVDLVYDVIIERYKTKVKKLVFSKEITEIEWHSFENFTALEDIQFGGVKTIRDSAFTGCTALKSLHLDENIEEIGTEAFCDCKNLTTVTVGPKVKTVYWDIFKGCDALTSISISKENKNLYTDGKKLLNTKVSGKCGKNVTYFYNRKNKTLTLSGSGTMYNGEYYEDEDSGDYVCKTPFSGCPDENVITNEMETLVIGDKITSIGNSGFQNCTALKTVKLGKNVNTIGKYAFAGCSNLKKINSSTSLTKIGNYAFWECQTLKNFSIGKAVKSIGEGTFFQCAGLKSLSVHKNNKYFSKHGNMVLNKKQSKLVSACFGSNKTCNIYDSVKELGKTLLEDTSVKSFSVSKKNAKYASKNGLLYSKNGKTLKKCPAKMSRIVNIGDTVTEMDSLAFTDCNQITQINIGKNMKKIAFSKYFSAKKINKIQISNKNKYYYEANGSIIEKGNNELIFCYKIEGDTYTIPDSVQKIRSKAFCTQTNLKQVILSDTVSDLDGGAFDIDDPSADDLGLKIESMHLGNSFDFSSNHNYMALQDLSALKAVTVSNENPNYTTLDGVLYNKDVTELVFLPRGIEAYSLPESITNISENAFFGPHLKKLTLSDTITDPTPWLHKLDNLESLHLGKKVNNLRVVYMTNLKSISIDEENSTFKVIDNMLYSKDGSHFIWCPAQTEGKVVLQDGVTEITEGAFQGCTKITDIVIPNTVSKISDHAFGFQNAQKTYLIDVDSIVIWVPKGTKDFYKSLFTEDTGFVSNMVIMELEN